MYMTDFFDKISIFYLVKGIYIADCSQGVAKKPLNEKMWKCDKIYYNFFLRLTPLNLQTASKLEKESNQKKNSYRENFITKNTELQSLSIS